MNDKVFTQDFILNIEDAKFDDAGEALSSVALNRSFNYLKFILTDDKPNANKMRVPLEEFDNLVTSGVFTPFKMAYSEIKEGHDDALPLGVITSLTKQDNQIKGIAALWSRERPDDINFLKQAFAEKRPINVSWEITYTDTKEESDGTQALLNTALRGVVIVGMPAYEGRTPVYAFASTKSKEGDFSMDELEETKQKLADLQKLYDELKASHETQDTELAALKEFKAAADKKDADSARLLEIKKKFNDAKITKDDKYFEDNRETLLSMSDSAIDFMLQDLAVFASASKKDKDGKEIPDLHPEDDAVDLKDPKVLASELKKRLAKK